MLWSSIPGTGTIVLLGLAGKEMIGRRYGLIAAGVAAVYPGLWVYDGLLLSETVAMFTVAGVILFAYRYWNHPSIARVAWLGAWCGLAALSRSELHPHLPARHAAARPAHQGSRLPGCASGGWRWPPRSGSR